MMPESGNEKPISRPAPPAISVVMPVWNKDTTVGRAIESVLAQTVQDWELIIVNDGSTDGSVAAASWFTDPRIRMVHQENQGVSAARNRGIQEASCSWVAFLDADDEWLPDFLSTILHLRTRFPEATLCSTAYEVVTPGGRRVCSLHRRAPAPEGWLIKDYFTTAIHADPPVCSSAVAVERQALIHGGGFPVGVASGEDLLAWARMACRGGFGYHPKPCARFYWQGTSLKEPGRKPQAPDKVEAGLRDLLAQVRPEHRVALSRYIGFWKSMRAVAYLRLGENTLARGELASARTCGLYRLRHRLLFALSCLPPALSVRLYFVLRAVRRQIVHIP